jgi:hypothetical protein
MNASNLLAVAAGTGALFLWLALLGIVALALLLYIPRRFSGPLTEHERQTARGGARWRSLMFVLATPVATIAGFVLLLPPFVDLQVQSRVLSGTQEEPCESDPSALSILATDQSTRDWTDAVLCRMEHPQAGREALAHAIVAAASAGFRVPEPCKWRAEQFNVSEIVSVELSLVELASRAYLLTGVQIDPGPRLEDPDPWELLKRTLHDRGVPACIAPRAALADDGVEVLRLGRARVHPSNQVFAVVRGNVCDGVDATLVSSEGKEVDTCRLQLSHSEVRCDPVKKGQRAVEMDFTCQSYDRERIMNEPGLSLRAGYGETPVYAKRPVNVTLSGEYPSESFRVALAATMDPGSGFPAELQRHELAAIVAASPEAIAIELHEDQIVIRSPRGERGRSRIITTHPALARGPFSWSGFPEPPRITCAGDQVTIHASPAILSPDESNRYEPTAMFALMHTITWAANVLQSGSCHEARQPISLVPRFRSHPLLSADEIDEAVAALRREREALGLVLLALAIASLALSLWRSVR